MNLRSLLVLTLIMPILAYSSTETVDPTDQTLYEQYPWSVMYYYGVTVNAPLVRVIGLSHLERWPEHIQSAELVHTLDEDNFLRRLVEPIVGLVQVAGNFTVRDGKDQHTIYEFDPYIIFRWANLPWNDKVTTSFAFAEGVSYDTSISSIERRDNSNTKRFLNYLMFEATMAIPENPRLQLVYRIHHRSGAYGLYRAGNTGSNDVGVGLRYLF